MRCSLGPLWTRALCTDPEETLPRRFSLSAAGVFLVTVDSSASADQKAQILNTNIKYAVSEGLSELMQPSMPPCQPPPPALLSARYLPSFQTTAHSALHLPTLPQSKQSGLSEQRVTAPALASILVRSLLRG